MTVERIGKGRSLIALPNSYVVVDTETTGLDFEFCEIIEISAIKVQDGLVVDRFSSLVQPSPYLEVSDDGRKSVAFVSSFITALTGITNEMLAVAPPAQDVIPSFLSFAGDSILLAHNANFDINFIFDAAQTMGLAFGNDFIDTLRIFRKALPDLSHHRLIDVCNALAVPYEQAHRAEADCIVTHSCYQKVRDSILAEQAEDDFINSFKPKSGKYSGRKLDARTILAETDDFDPTHPLFGQTIVFTGALSSMQRREAMQLVANIGGVNANSVTKKTNYLVVGSEEFAASVKNGKTTKMKKAEELRLKGADLSVISESAFFDLLYGK